MGNYHLSLRRAVSKFIDFHFFCRRRANMDNTFVCKSMFTWYKEMLNLDQQVTDETIIIAAEVCCRVWPSSPINSILDKEV